MQVALIIIGAVLLSVGFQGPTAMSTLAGLLQSDFTGAGSFWYFVVGIFAAGALGYYSPFSGASKLLLLLIILVLFLSNGGFFAQLTAALQAPKPANLPESNPAAPTVANPAAPGAVTIGPTQSLGAGGIDTVLQGFGLPPVGNVGITLDPGSIGANIAKGQWFGPDSVFGPLMQPGFNK